LSFCRVPEVGYPSSVWVTRSARAGGPEGTMKFAKMLLAVIEQTQPAFRDKARDAYGG